MLDALVTLKGATYIGAATAARLMLHGQPLELAQIGSLKLWAGDFSGSLITTDGAALSLYEKRRFGRPKLLLTGQITLAISAHGGEVVIDIGKVVYMTLGRPG